MTIGNKVSIEDIQNASKGKKKERVLTPEELIAKGEAIIAKEKRPPEKAEETKEEPEKEMEYQIPEIPDLPPTGREWSLDPENFINKKNLEKINITEKDLSEIFFSKDFAKTVKINDIVSVRYRSLTKKETDEIDDNLLKDENPRLIEVQKQAEIYVLSKSVLSINGESIGDTEEEKIATLIGYPNIMFRLLWNWYLVFERSIIEAATVENLKKS